MRKQANGLVGEQNVYNLLSGLYNRRVHMMPYNSGFDMRVDEIHVEVKTAKPRKQDSEYAMLSWCFNIHRRGKMPEQQPDCYLLRLEDVPYTKNAIHLVFMSPVTTPTIFISIRALLDQRYHLERSQFIALTQGTLQVPRLQFKLPASK